MSVSWGRGVFFYTEATLILKWASRRDNGFVSQTLKQFKKRVGHSIWALHWDKVRICARASLSCFHFDVPSRLIQVWCSIEDRLGKLISLTWPLGSLPQQPTVYDLTRFGPEALWIKSYYHNNILVYEIDIIITWCCQHVLNCIIIQEPCCIFKFVGPRLPKPAGLRAGASQAWPRLQNDNLAGGFVRISRAREASQAKHGFQARLLSAQTPTFW